MTSHPNTFENQSILSGGMTIPVSKGGEKTIRNKHTVNSESQGGQGQGGKHSKQ
jgi:hypothetical protein